VGIYREGTERAERRWRAHTRREVTRGENVIQMQSNNKRRKEN